MLLLRLRRRLLNRKPLGLDALENQLRRRRLDRLRKSAPVVLLIIDLRDQRRRLAALRLFRARRRLILHRVRPLGDFPPLFCGHAVVAVDSLLAHFADSLDLEVVDCFFGDFEELVAVAFLSLLRDRLELHLNLLRKKLLQKLLEQNPHIGVLIDRHLILGLIINKSLLVPELEKVPLLGLALFLLQLDDRQPGFT
jgi:hypothetical protein